MHEIVKSAIFPTSSSFFPTSTCVIRLLLVVVLHILGLLSDATIGRCAFNKNLNDGFNCGGAIDIVSVTLRHCIRIDSRI